MFLRVCVSLSLSLFHKLSVRANKLVKKEQHTDLAKDPKIQRERERERERESKHRSELIISGLELSDENVNIADDRPTTDALIV
jgi:hypothetical protein